MALPNEPSQEVCRHDPGTDKGRPQRQRLHPEVVGQGDQTLGKFRIQDDPQANGFGLRDAGNRRADRKAAPRGIPGILSSAAEKKHIQGHQISKGRPALG